MFEEEIQKQLSSYNIPGLSLSNANYFISFHVQPRSQLGWTCLGGEKCPWLCIFTSWPSPAVSFHNKRLWSICPQKEWANSFHRSLPLICFNGLILDIPHTAKIMGLCQRMQRELISGSQLCSYLWIRSCKDDSPSLKGAFEWKLERG